MILLDFLQPGAIFVRNGGGTWDSGAYHTSSSTRAATGTKDFAYTESATKVHSSLDPKRINSKPVGKLESRDNDEHPNSTPVLVAFDVTGSNIDRAREFQKKLPTLMELLQKYITDPQVAVAANDDYNYCGTDSIQISEFESDIRVDEHIRNIWLVGLGGGNRGESYDLLLYAAGRKIATDSMEKRDKKGYFFMYADEPIFEQVKASEVLAIYGDRIEADIPIAEMIEEVRRNWNLFVIWPTRGYDFALEQYRKLFAPEEVVESQDPNLLCELIASLVGLYENKATAASVVTDLVAVGAKDADARKVSTALAKYANTATSTLATSGAGKAARL